MKHYLLILLSFFTLNVFAQTVTTLQKAKAWQNTYVPFTWYGLTANGHPYASGLECNFNLDGTPAAMELARIDLVTKDVTYKVIDSMLSPGSPNTAVWAHTFDSLGNYYIGLNYPKRAILKVNLKNGISIENLGGGFLYQALAYSMSLGTDSHIYFGGSSGDTYASEYDPKNDVWVHKWDAIDTWNDYVQQIVGDSGYIYTQVGQRNNIIKLYATNKETGVSTELFHIPATARFQLEVKQDHHIYMSTGVDTLKKTFWLYHGQAIKLWDKQNWWYDINGNNVNARMDYYEIGDYQQTRVNSFYDQYNSILYGTYQPVWGQPFPPFTAYQIKSNKQPNTVKLIFGDKTKPNDIGYVGNNYGIFFWYNAAADSASILGSTTQNIYTAQQWNDSLIEFGTYPNGTILEWNTHKAWTSLTYNLNGTSTSTTATTNPAIIGSFRTATPANFHHAKFSVNMGNYLVFGGDVIRTGNTCSVGGINPDTHEIWGYDCNRIDRLSMTGMAKWNDKVIIATSNAYGGTPKLYIYDGRQGVNTMVDSIQAGWANYAVNGNIYVVGDTLIGSHAAYEYYKINLRTKQIIQDTSFLYYYSGQLEDGYIGMNTPTSKMPTSYMLKVYNVYNMYSLNHNVYNISWDGYSINKITGIYPQQSQNSTGTKLNSTTVYPNPANNYIHVPFGNYSLITLSGKTVLTVRNVSIINVSHMASGTYILRSDKTNATIKVVIK